MRAAFGTHVHHPTRQKWFFLLTNTNFTNKSWWNLFALCVCVSVCASDCPPLKKCPIETFRTFWKSSEKKLDRFVHWSRKKSRLRVHRTFIHKFTKQYPNEIYENVVFKMKRSMYCCVFYYETEMCANDRPRERSRRAQPKAKQYECAPREKENQMNKTNEEKNRTDRRTHEKCAREWVWKRRRKKRINFFFSSPFLLLRSFPYMYVLKARRGIKTACIIQHASEFLLPYDLSSRDRDTSTLYHITVSRAYTFHYYYCFNLYCFDLCTYISAHTARSSRKLQVFELLLQYLHHCNESRNDNTDKMFFSLFLLTWSVGCRASSR